jgi:hypothetical protein
MLHCGQVLAPEDAQFSEDGGGTTASVPGCGRRGVREDAVAGHGRLAMQVDEPGIGKRRTAQELAEYAEGQGVQVLWGRCQESQGSPPNWP